MLRCKFAVITAHYMIVTYHIFVYFWYMLLWRNFLFFLSNYVLFTFNNFNCIWLINVSHQIDHFVTRTADDKLVSWFSKTQKLRIIENHFKNRRFGCREKLKMSKDIKRYSKNGCKIYFIQNQIFLKILAIQFFTISQLYCTKGEVN